MNISLKDFKDYSHTERIFSTSNIVIEAESFYDTGKILYHIRKLNGNNHHDTVRRTVESLAAALEIADILLNE